MTTNRSGRIVWAATDSSVCKINFSPLKTGMMIMIFDFMPASENNYARWILQARWMVQKSPRDAEFFGEMPGECFHAEGFSRVMAAVQDVQSKLLRQRIGPVRAFTSDEGVHAFASGESQFTARSSRHYADAPTDRRPSRQQDGRAAHGLTQALRQFVLRNFRFGL